MLKVKEGYPVPSSKYSKKKVVCVCDCGNPKEIETRWNSFARRNPSCGECALWKWKLSGILKFSKLTLVTPVNEIRTLSRQNYEWLCDCGKAFESPIFRVMNGNTTSCGCAYIEARKNRNIKRHPEKSKEYWLNQIPNLIDQGLPIAWSLGSRFRPNFRCYCGKSFSMTFWAYKPGISKCGKCEEVYYDRNLSFGVLKYADVPGLFNKLSNIKKLFECTKCNKIDEYNIRYLKDGSFKRCRHCSNVHISKHSKFGRYNALDNHDKIRELKCPILIHDIPEGGVTPLEVINTTKTAFKARCPSCNSIYGPRWEDVRRGVSLTCGCTSGHISSAVLELQEYLLSVDISSTLEYELNGLKYDLYIESHGLLIEFNGLRWHSLGDSKTRDIKKYKNSLGHEYLMIYEDEWVKKNHIVKTLILNRLGLSHPTSFRYQKTEIRSVNHSVVDPFYDKYHYIGKVNARINYGVFLKEKLVAAISFKRPTRQSRHDWELVRMVSEPGIRIHGIWSKLLQIFRKDHCPVSIVSFSDNRIFTGSVYQLMGFKFDGDVRPDYYWVDGSNRKHKSTMRKRPNEKGTETELRTAQGMRKIYDLGKKRWVALY